MEEYQAYSLRGRVFQSIRENILNGVYEENEELRENTIANELGVSRTPVREALRQLELEGLVNISNQLNEANRKLTEEEFNNLKQIYAQTENAFNDYFKDEAKFKGLEVSRAGILKDILKVLKKDIKELDACDPKEPGTLSEIIDRSRSHMITISEKDISTIGGNLSERIPIKSNKGPKGFFTRKTYFNPDNEWSKKLEDFENVIESLL